MKVKIINQDVFGDGVAKVDNVPIFVTQALPDEEVDITITQDKKKYKRAKINDIITPSINRVKPLCPYYNVCGGCNIMHQKYEATLDFKKNKVLNNLSKIAGLNDLNISKIILSDQFNYRNKVTLHVKNGQLGFYKKNSNDLIKIENCLLLNDKINTIITQMYRLDLKNILEVTIRTSEYNGKTLVLLKYDNDINKLIVDLTRIKEIDNIIITKKDKYKTVYNNDYITEKIGNYLFNISASSFFQVNTKVATKLYEEILAAVEDNNKDNVLDLYCGTGSIGISLASHVKKVIGIEQQPSAIDNAKLNKELNKVSNVEFILGNVEDIINDIKKADVVILDPPRSGCDPKTLSHILKLKPKQIVYVSCDSATLARDIKYISANYEVKDLKLFDMFPNTYHVECLANLHRKKA